MQRNSAGLNPADILY